MQTSNVMNDVELSYLENNTFQFLFSHLTYIPMKGPVITKVGECLLSF